MDFLGVFGALLCKGCCEMCVGQGRVAKKHGTGGQVSFGDMQRGVEISCVFQKFTILSLPFFCESIHNSCYLGRCDLSTLYAAS